jgi:hypothetical protein
MCFDGRKVDDGECRRKFVNIPMTQDVNSSVTVDQACEMMGSVDKDRIPSSTRIWPAEQAKNKRFPLFYPLPLRLGGAAAGRVTVHSLMSVLLQTWPSLIRLRLADSRALSGAARGMLKLLLVSSSDCDRD